MDYKKENKDLYLPKTTPSLINVPKMNFIMIDGSGDPNNKAFGKSVEALYALSYTIKMSPKKGKIINNFFEYTVPPLEGLWWISDSNFSLEKRDNWLWTAMIRQPEFVDQEVFNWAISEVKRKKPEIDLSKVRLESYQEGLSVQVMHIGPFKDEPTTMEKIKTFINENNLTDLVGLSGKHHEIYLSDPRKGSPEKMKTVLRHPVK